jgi:hypothetical protein
MLADLDLLLTAVFCAADDFLPEPGRNARRRVTDAEVVTLCVAQQPMNVGLTASFWRSRAGGWGTWFRACRSSPGFTSAGAV